MIPPDCVPSVGEVVFEILKGPVRPGVYQFFIYWQVLHVDRLPDGDGPFTKAQIFLAALESYRDDYRGRGFSVRTVDRRVPPVAPL